MIWPAIVEKPPSQYIPAPSEMDRRVETWLSPSEANRVCTIWAGPPPVYGHVYNGCYVPGIDVIYMRNDWPPNASEALRIHEHAHRARGWRHSYERW